MRLFLPLVFLFGCTHHYLSEVRADLQEGRYKQAENHLIRADIPYQKSNDAPLLLLSRGMVYFQAGKMEQSFTDFSKAIDAIDYYRQPIFHDIAAQTVLQDDLGPYLPPPFEEGLSHFYQALALLANGDEDNAAATLLYLENHAHANPLTTYLLAVLFERRGDSSNASILFRRLGLPVNRGNLIIVHHLGESPTKTSEIAPVSVVNAALLETMLAADDVEPALSTLVGIPVPKLNKSNHATSHHTPTLRYDITHAAEKQLQHDMPLIATRAAARLLIRRGAIAAVKKPYQPIADIAMFISNSTTRADTRCWNTLPGTIDLFHLTLPPGNHTLPLFPTPIEVKENGVTIVHYFNRKDHYE